MIHFVAFLMVSYGICFGLMNKIPFLYDRVDFLDRLFQCSYCTGFWSSMCALLLIDPMRYLVVDWTRTWELIAYSFGGAIFCYIVDTLLTLVESFGGSGE